MLVSRRIVCEGQAGMTGESYVVDDDIGNANSMLLAWIT